MLKPTLLFVLALISLSQCTTPKDHLCSQPLTIRIVGTLSIGSTVWLVFETSPQAQTYLVYDFAPEAALSTVLDSSKLREAVPLQSLLKVDKKISPAGRKIVSMFAVEQGVVFVFEDKTELFNNESNKMTVLDSGDLANSIPLVSPNREGVLLSGGTQWHMQKIVYQSNLAWPKSLKFALSEKARPDPVWSAEVERILILTNFATSNSEGVRDVTWKWAQGYIGADQLYHIFTDEGVYLFERPDDQEPRIITVGLNKVDKPVVIQLKALKLNYSDYFVCNQSKLDAAAWSRVYQALVYMRLEAPNALASKNRSTVIFVLFGLHALVATIMIVAIVFMSVFKPEAQGPASARSVKSYTQKKRSKSKSPNSKSKEKSSSPSKSADGEHKSPMTLV